MRALLEGWGCGVILAESAAEAIVALPHNARRPDIIFADYHLDSGTGLDAIAAVRAAVGADIPAIVITADHSAEVQRRIRQSDCGLLRKPLKAAAFRALLSQLLRQRPAAAE